MMMFCISWKHAFVASIPWCEIMYCRSEWSAHLQPVSALKFGSVYASALRLMRSVSVSKALGVIQDPSDRQPCGPGS